MPNIKAFWPEFHEKKIFEYLTIFSLFCPLMSPKRGQPLFMNKSESPSLKHVSHLSLVEIGQVFDEKKILKGFYYIKLCPVRAWPFMTPGTSFEQTLISLPKGCSLPNIKSFRPVVHEKKIFEDLTKFSLFSPLMGPKRGQPLFMNKSESPSLKHVSHTPSLVEIGQVVHEKKIFKVFTI